MSNPKWQDMKQLTDKDLRRKAKERERMLELEREARERVAARNKIVFAAVAFVALAALAAAWYFVSVKREEIGRIKDLSGLALESPRGDLQFRETNGGLSREARPAIVQNEGVVTGADGRVTLSLHEKRTLSILPGSEFVATEVRPLPNMAGVHVAGKLKSGALVVESRQPVGSVTVEAGHVTARANPRTVSHFKLEHRKLPAGTAVRCACREGEVQVKHGDKPAIRLADRQELVVHADGKIEGPTPIVLGNEAWR